jgi:Fcf2 pre-rRNA processing
MHLPTDFHSHKLKERTAGPKWFDLPAPAEADRPRLYKEYQALRLRNQLDPKRFYRKDPGESRGIKGLPKHFAVRFQPWRPVIVIYLRT